MRFKSVILASLITLSPLSVSVAKKSTQTDHKKLDQDPIDPEKLRALTKKHIGAVVPIYITRNGVDKEDGRIFNLAVVPKNERKRHNNFVKSGIIVSPQGHILTTADGIERGDHILVNIGEGGVDVREKGQNTYEAVVIEVSPELGLALLKIDPRGGVALPFIPIGNAPSLVAGQPISGVAMGHAKGDVFVGVACQANKNSTFGPFAMPAETTPIKKDGAWQLHIVQTVGKGGWFELHGGVLIDRNGRVIGLIVAGVDQFYLPVLTAIPVSIVAKVLRTAVPSLLKTADTVHLGITPCLKPAKTIGKAGLEALEWDVVNYPSLVVIKSIQVGSPADNAGLLPGDVILRIGDEEVKNLATFKNLVNDTIGTNAVVFKVLRDGKITEFELSLV
ncbi:MAG: S1C family serine protease [Holosporales bacterium]|nr:S1C family serine protease [Holosporales bacterium]